MAFGPRVIGADAYNRQKAAVKNGAGFGPRVGGKGRRTAAASGTASDPAVAGAIAPAPGTLDGPGEPATTGMSVEQFKAVLAENPKFLDTLVTQELERPEGPRREALEAARVVAEAEQDDETVVEIDEALALLPEVETGTGSTNPADIEAARAESKAKTIEQVKVLDNFKELQSMAKSLGLDTGKLRSKDATRDAILAKLAE